MNSPHPAAGRARLDPVPPLRAVRASLIGTVVEYYDFAIYGYMATVLASLFFVSDSETAGLLGTFATFAVAFFLRIPGGLLFGHIGDRYGRRTALSWTILLMAAATAMIGLLPSYATLGIWATVVLTLCRCLQGISAGGELGGAMAYVAETAPPRSRGAHTAIVSAGTYVGSLAASVSVLLLNAAFTPEQVLAFAWRIPFLLSLILGLTGLWIRSRMQDTVEFRSLQQEGEIAQVPVRQLWREARGTVLRIALLGAAIVGSYYVSTIYGATYMQTVGGLSPLDAFASTSVALVVGITVVSLAGRWSDRFGRRRLFLGGVVSSIVLAVPCIALMGSGSLPLAVVGQSVLVAATALVSGPSFASYAEMLRPHYRYTGIALGNNLTNLTVGGTAPLICQALISTTGLSISPAFFMVFCGVLTGIGLMLTPETAPRLVDRTLPTPGTARPTAAGDS